MKIEMARFIFTMLFELENALKLNVNWESSMYNFTLESHLNLNQSTVNYVPVALRNFKT